MRNAFIILLLGFFNQVSAQKSTCEKEIEVFEATQLQFTDAGEALSTYQSYLLHNQATLSPDCSRRIYSLMANFAALGASINAADSFFKQAIYYSTLCAADTAKIFALLDYARFLNNVAPDSFIVYSNIAYRQLNAFAQKNNPLFAAWLAARPVLADQITSSSDRETVTPPLTLISDLTNTVKSLWRQYFELQGSSLIYSKSPGAAEANLNMALFFDRNNPEDDNESVSLNNLGMLYQNEGRHTTAVEYFLKAIEKNKNSKQEYAVIATLGNITYSFRMIRRFDVARQYSVEAIEIARRLKLIKSLCRALSQYASVFIDEGNFVEAEKQLRESIALSHQTGNKADLCYSMRKLGNMFIVNTNNLVAGKQLIDSSAYYAAAIGDKSFLYFINNTLAAYYLKTGDYNTAMTFATSSYAESVAYQDKEIALSNLNLLHQLYEKKGDAALALQYYKLFINLKDSSSGKEMHYALSDIQEKYESQKKQLAIDALEKEKLKRRQQFIALIIGLCVLSILVGLVYFFNRKLNQQKKVLQQNNHLLTEATATQNRLFGIIGHDLKGMVAPFSRAGKIMSHYIAKNNLQDAVVFSSKLEENAGRLSETLNNLLHWSVQQMKGLQIQPQSLHVGETIRHIVDHYTDVIRLKNIKVQVDIPPSETLFTDKEAFQVIVRNLLSNAIKFTENNSIVFSSQDTGTQYQLTIADTGTGMTDRQVSQLFSVGNKVTGTGTQGETGSGLGLIVVKKMAEALNASLQITSTLQSGTSITIMFKKENA